MTRFLLIGGCVFALSVCATQATWEGVGLTNGEVSGMELYMYDFWGRVVSEGQTRAWTEGSFFGYEADGRMRLKQLDHSTTPMPVDNNVWVLAYFGEVLNAETIRSAEHIELCAYSDWTLTGGTLVEDPADMYLGFMVTGSNVKDGVDRYGWFHVSIDDNMEMSIIESGIGLYGESVVVGAVTPEPTGGTLLLLGLSALMLCRSKRPGAPNKTWLKNQTGSCF